MIVAESSQNHRMFYSSKITSSPVQIWLAKNIIKGYKADRNIKGGFIFLSSCIGSLNV